MRWPSCYRNRGFGSIKLVLHLESKALALSARLSQEGWRACFLLAVLQVPYCWHGVRLLDDIDENL
jgi:hypothetical protein